MDGVSLLVPVDNHAVCSQSHGQEMVGDKAVQQIVLVCVVLVHLCVGVEVLGLQIVHYIAYGDVQRFLAQFLLPEGVGLGKIGVSVITVFGHLSLGESDTGSMFHGFGNQSFLVTLFILVVSVFVERIQHAHGLDKHGRYVISGSFLVVDGFQQVAQGVVGGSHHVVHTVDDTVLGLYISVIDIHACTVDPDAVRYVAIGNHQFTLIHIGEGELAFVHYGEIGGFIGQQVVAHVNDAVVHDYLSHGVKRCGIAETVPVGCVNDALHGKCVQIELYGFIGGCEYGIVSSCRKQLFECGLGDGTYFYLSQQVYILAILVLLGQVAVHGLFSENITGRHINVFLASDEGHGDEQTQNDFSQFFMSHHNISCFVVLNGILVACLPFLFANIHFFRFL